MDPNALGAELMKNPQFMEMFQKALGEEKIPDEKDPNRDKWLKGLQEKIRLAGREDAKKKLEEPVTDGDGTWMWVVPDPGFCIKVATNNGGKVFINVCQHARIAEPIPLPQEEQEEDDTIKYKIPLSCGQARPGEDKSGKPCKIYDVIVNPNTIKRCSEDSEFRRFVAALCMTWIKQKSEPTLNADEFKNVNFKCKGVPEAQRIRLANPSNAPHNAVNGEIKLPGNANAARTPSVQGGTTQKKLVQEMDEATATTAASSSAPSKPQPSVKVEQSGTYDWSTDPQAVKSPFFRENVPEKLTLHVHLPGVLTIKEVDVQVLSRRVDFVYVDAEDGVPFFSAPLPFPVSEEPAGAKFVRATNTLALQLTVSLPLFQKVAASRDVAEEEAEALAKEEAASQARIAEHRAKLDRLKKEEETVMQQRKEWVENLNAVAEGHLPPSLVEEIKNMPKAQQQHMLGRVEGRVLRGDSVDALIQKMPSEALDAVARLLRSELGLVIPENLQPRKATAATAAAPAQSEEPAPAPGSSVWERKLEDAASRDTVEYNFAKKAQNLFGIEMHNRYLFALDH